ncbi:Strictosidine synthase, conserved region [Sesbania bispinosa]|nr:Strictosidine synthase, conserved region [Sesbania bispinosa]
MAFHTFLCHRSPCGGGCDSLPARPVRTGSSPGPGAGPSTWRAPARNERMKRGSEAVAEGQVMGPEDLVYDAARGVVYTGCEDGWIKRVTLNDSVADSVVENWVNTGGRPLGLAFDHNVVLTTHYDGVDVAHDGTIYFTDASYKYSVKDSVIDILEGKPNGRFLSYNPATNKTTLLAHDLYFPNGVALSPDQQFVLFCETVLMRCMKYYIQGPKKGSIDKFCDLPGMPDTIHYDGQGQYWIGIATVM